MKAFSDWFNQNTDWIYNTFKKLHSLPEAGFCEFKTSEFIAGILGTHGWEVKRNFAQTAVLGIRRGDAPGPCVCLRSDMDALTFTLDGKSKCIHACGHDANMTEVLAVAAAASDCGFPEKGTLMVLFQPCEEGMMGALSVVKSGVLKDVDYLIGTHLRPSLELTTGACPAIIHGAMTVAKVTVHGKSAHGGRPKEGINAVTIGSEIVVNVAGIERTDGTPFSIKATRFNTAQGSVNIIPAEVEICFDIRAQTNTCMEELKCELQSICEAACSKYGAVMNIEYTGGVPAAELSPELIDAASDAIRRVYGNDGLHSPVVTPGGEDFHFYTREIPEIKATVLGFGAKMQNGLHNPDMTFDIKVLPLAARTLGETINILINK